MSEFLIRSATVDDATGISIVQVYTWATAYHGLMPDEVLKKRIDGVKENADRIKDNIENGKFAYSVAVYNKAVIGFVSYGKSRNIDYPSDGEIGALYVLKGFTGYGLGRKLIETAKNELAEYGCTDMIVNCLQGNAALEFYRHMGGIVTGRRTDEIYSGHIITEDILRFTI